MKRLLQDQIILVVGGTTGIGWSATQCILDAGGSAMVVGPTAEDVERSRLRWESQATQDKSQRIAWYSGNAADPATAKTAVQTTVDQFGSLHGLVHVAGGSGRSHGDGPLDSIPDDGWRWTLGNNLDSVAYSNRAALQFWLEQDHPGSIVNIGSVLADRPARRFFATHAYAAAKAAIVGLSLSVANYYATNNIRCNVISPGLIDTPMSERALGDQEIIDYVRHRQPLDEGRAGEPDEVAHAIVFLLSDQSRFITGQTLRVDGGWSVSEGESP